MDRCVSGPDPGGRQVGSLGSTLQGVRRGRGPKKGGRGRLHLEGGTKNTVLYVPEQGVGVGIRVLLVKALYSVRLCIQQGDGQCLPNEASH